MTKQERFLLFSLVSEVKDLMCDVCKRPSGCYDCAIESIKSELYPWRSGKEVNEINDPTLYVEFCRWHPESRSPQNGEPQDSRPQERKSTGDCEPSFGGYTTEEYLESLESLDRLQKKLGL